MAIDSAVVDDEASAEEQAVDEPSVVPVDALDGVADADEHEAAAIAVAIAAHLTDRQAAAAAAAAADSDDGEKRRTWAFAGRLEAVGEPAGRPSITAPEDGWTAAGRADRF